MFGPDICGYSTRKTHAILTYKGKNLLTKKNIRAETDKLSHRYTLVIHPDNTYEVQIDGSKVESGNLADDWDFLAPKLIKDPEAKKPADWVDEAQIPDPSDVKPAGYDDTPAKIPDPSATVRVLQRPLCVCVRVRVLTCKCDISRAFVVTNVSSLSLSRCVCRSLRIGTRRMTACGRPLRLTTQSTRAPGRAS